MVSVNTLLLLLNNVIILTFAKLTPLKNPLRLYSPFVHKHLKNSVVNALIIDDRYYHDLSETTDYFPLYIVRTQTDFKENPQNYIIAVENITDILAENLPGTATYFVIVNDTGLVSNTAETLWKFRLPYSFIISTDTGLIYALKIEDCGSKVSPKLVPNDLKTISKWDIRVDFDSCPIYVIWALMPPFVNDFNSSREGIFIELVKTMSMFKRKIIRRPHDPVYLEEIAQSYNFITVIEDMENEYAQIFVGPTEIHAMSVLHLSPILIENGLQFLTPRPINRLLEIILSWQMVRITCLNVVIQLLLVCTFYYLAKNTADRFLFSSIAKTYFLVVGFVLNIPTLHRLPRTRHLQIYLGVCLLQFMVFSIFVQGSLVSGLSGALYGKPIESLEALLESNVPIKSIEGISFLFRLGRNDLEREVYRRFEVLQRLSYPFQAGNIAVRTRDFATIVDNGYMLMRPNILKSFSTFEFFNIKQVLAMPKHAYFVDQYNEWILNLLEIGIMTKFMKLYEHFYALRHFVEEDKRNFVLTFHQIRPVLILVSIGFSMAFIVFIVEILVAKSQLLFYRRRNVIIQFTN